MIPTFLTSLLGGGRSLGLLAAAAMAAVLAIQGLRLSHAHAELSRARVALVDPESGRPWRDVALQTRDLLGHCQSARAQLSTSLRTQSEAIARLREDTDARVRAAQQAVVSARTLRSDANRRAADILGRQQGGADACDAALQLLRGAA